MSKYYFEVTNPDEIQLQLTARMSLKEWKELRAVIGIPWPGTEFKREIDDMISQAEKHFYPAAPATREEGK